MDNTSLRDDYLIFYSDYTPGLDSISSSYIYQLDITASNHEQNFQNRSKELYDYLNYLLGSNDSFISPIFSEGNYPIVNDAKTKFRETSLNVIDGIKNSFQQDHRYQLLPDKYLQETVESMKQHLFISYNKMMQNVANLAQNSAPIYSSATAPAVDPNPVETRQKQKLKPGKTKFPKKARLVLEGWYKAHSEDPFPSYAEKVRLAEEGGITMKQVKCWFINVRRKWKQELNDDEDFKAQIEKKLLTIKSGVSAMAANSVNLFPQ